MIQNSGYFLHNMIKIVNGVNLQDMETLPKQYHKTMIITAKKITEIRGSMDERCKKTPQ